jgi:hypothetical protein
MSALLNCVAAWLALNAATFAVLMLRPDASADAAKPHTLGTLDRKMSV